MTLQEIIANFRNHEYMSGVERDKLRIKETAEVFTPTELVQEMLDQLPAEVFGDITKTFLEPSCGDGQFLSEVVIRKIEHAVGEDYDGDVTEVYKQALRSVYGVELMEDNVELCIQRLTCGNIPEFEEALGNHILKADFLKFAPILEKAETWDEAVKKYIDGLYPALGKNGCITIG